MRAAIIAVLILSGLMQSAASAAEIPVEIDYLLTTMGSSDCTFIRNGKEYAAKDAEEHLRMKYRRGRRYASTAEDFIENLASQSWMSKRPYHIACEGKEKIESGSWLTQLLVEYRKRPVTHAIEADVERPLRIKVDFQDEESPASAVSKWGPTVRLAQKTD